MIWCKNYSKLKMKTLVQHQQRRFGAFIVNCEHISLFVLTVDFEQAKVCWVHIEQTRSGISCVVLSILTVNKICQKIAFELISSQPYGYISEKVLRRSLLSSFFLAANMRLKFKMACCTFVFIQILLAGRLIRLCLKVDKIAFNIH